MGISIVQVFPAAEFTYLNVGFSAVIRMHVIAFQRQNGPLNRI